MPSALPAPPLRNRRALRDRGGERVHRKRQCEQQERRHRQRGVFVLPRSPQHGRCPRARVIVPARRAGTPGGAAPRPVDCRHTSSGRRAGLPRIARPGEAAHERLVGDAQRGWRSIASDHENRDAYRAERFAGGRPQRAVPSSQRQRARIVEIEGFPRCVESLPASCRRCHVDVRGHGSGVIACADVAEQRVEVWIRASPLHACPRRSQASPETRRRASASARPADGARRRAPPPVHPSKPRRRGRVSTPSASDQADEVIGVLRHRVRSAVVGPRVRRMVPPAEGDETKLVTEPTSHVFPDAIVGRRTVQEHDGFACTLLDVGQLRTVDRCAAYRGVRGGLGRPLRASGKNQDDRQAGLDQPHRSMSHK